MVRAMGLEKFQQAPIPIGKRLVILGRREGDRVLTSQDGLIEEPCFRVGDCQCFHVRCTIAARKFDRS